MVLSKTLGIIHHTHSLPMVIRLSLSIKKSPFKPKYHNLMFKKWNSGPSYKQCKNTPLRIHNISI
ncbi:hypothetical protein HanPI659440_Chr07g0277571 [Helianthus annuus]|nr:hypothetical protein HanPI659440_Chr07g0277571 [Helianthus annuus]